VAGSFYPGSAGEIRVALASTLEHRTEPPRKARLAIAPHAGWAYSGGVAGAVFAGAEIPSTVLLLGVNHRGLGTRAAIWPRGAWVFPGTSVEIDERLAERCLEHAPALTDDELPHALEHSLEVEVPFLYTRNPRVRIVPISIGHLSPESCATLGRDLATAIEAHDGRVLVVCSTDMNHYESAEIGGRKDALAMDRIEAFDPAGLYRVVQQERISMCGVIPTCVGLHLARELGATRMERIAYAHSGMVTGDHQAVVGYAGFLSD